MQFTSTEQVVHPRKLPSSDGLLQTVCPLSGILKLIRICWLPPTGYVARRLVSPVFWGRGPTLGFILGDEGSGAVLGKLLVGDILKNQLPATLKEEFLKQFDLTPPEIIDRVYRQPFPNRFLASLSPFIAQHLEEPAIRQLVMNSFIAFFRRNVMQYDYKQYPVHFIGSIAYCYKEILQDAARQTGIQIGKILQSPMEGLIQYHSQLSFHP